MIFAGLVRLITGAQARWQGCAPEPRQRIYFANHVSNLDGPVIWATLPRALRLRTRPIAAQDYWEKGWVRPWLAHRVLKAVLIARTAIGARNNPLVPMEAALDEGSSLIIFPEGKRQGDEDAGMNPFKPGLWHLATRHPEVELVPVWLENLNRILPRGEILIVPLMASVTFGEPLARIADEDKAAFLARALAAVTALAAQGDA
ncbi:MAG: 1-acyl-sn-glycerol-3-phosphate acyltransferase [Planctomycetes bacterium]|nr:1-acyl-sn-glycerol-3-phosphate acyltransferase [Planctomycetota bacterium]